MLFQPSNIAPSTLSGIGIGTVDVTKGIDVSWQVNGDSPMTAYQITIYQNDSSSTQMFTTGEITLGTPFQPHDAQGNPMFFSTNINAASLASAGIVNGYANGYKLIIKQWWSANDYVEQTSASVFITRTTPTITIDAIPNPVASSNITITSTYSQAEGDPISTVEWTLALFGHEDNPIKQTGSISTQVLSFDADGLITGMTYSIMCSIVTSNGMEATTGFVQFSVSYQSSTLSMAYELAQMRRSSAVYLSWDNSGFRNILTYPYTDSTKTTNGITFTVNGEGNISAVGTASADAYFTIAEGTSASLGIVAGEKLILSSGRAGVKICVTETNSSNVVVSTVIGSDPLQYVLTNTQNKLTISIVISSGTSFNTAVTLLCPVICEESKIVAFTDVIANIPITQNLNGYTRPWPAGGGENKWEPMEGTKNGVTFTLQDDGSVEISGETTSASIPYVFQTVDLPWNGISAGDDVVLWSDKDNVVVCYEGDTNILSKFSKDGVAETFTIPANATRIRMTQYAKSTTPTAGEEFDTTGHYYLSKADAFTAWSPYENICPISGITGLSVYVSPTQDVADATTYAEDWTSQAGTVYGGTIDVVTGVLTVERAYVDMGSLTWTPNATDYMNFYSTGLQNVVKRPPNTATGHLYVVCSAYASIPPTAREDCYIYVTNGGQIRVKDTTNASLTGPQFKTLMSGVQLVYELATPVTYQLTPQEVTAFTANHIWSSSSGNVTVSYINENGELTTVSGANPYITDTKAVNIPMPTFIPNVTGLSIYRYAQGSDALHRVYDFTDSSTSILDYFVPSQQNVSYMVVAHTSGNDMIMRTSNFTPVYWFYSIILCSQDSNGVYHVRNEYAFKYGIETGQTSNNNSPGIQQNFTRYPTRQPTNSQYKTGSLKGYIGTVSNNMVYTDSVSLQDAIYQISTSNLTKFLKTRKGETIMVECSSPITMQTGDNFVQQPLVATINWVEVGDASDVSIVSIPTDGFWPL